VHCNIIRPSPLGYGEWNKQYFMLEMDFGACDGLIDPG
jgi:hypothetical protein